MVRKRTLLFLRKLCTLCLVLLLAKNLVPNVEEQILYIFLSEYEEDHLEGRVPSGKKHSSTQITWHGKNFQNQEYCRQTGSHYVDINKKRYAYNMALILTPVIISTKWIQYRIILTHFLKEVLKLPF